VVIALQSDGRISGRVLDSHGDPVPGQYVELVPLDRGVTPEFSHYSGNDGTYELKGVHPGSYYLGVNLSHPPSVKSPYFRTYAPDVHQRETAPIVHVDRAAKLTDRDIYLNVRCAPRPVPGVVLWPDGRPAAGAPVPIAYPDYLLRSDAATAANEQGRFAFTVWSGLPSFLWIQAPNAQGRWMNAGKIELPREGEIKPVLAILNQEPPKPRQ